VQNEVFVEQNLRNEYVLKGIIRDNRWKYVFTERSKLRDVDNEGSRELFDLGKDPKELCNLAAEEPGILESMQKALDSHERYCRERAIRSYEIELDSQTLEQLKSLGYVQ
jgi:hypothetical protein